MFLSSPHEQASIQEWKNYLLYLLDKDQRKPFVAMAIRRTRQHLEKRINQEKQVHDELKKDIS